VYVNWYVLCMQAKAKFRPIIQEKILVFPSAKRGITSKS